MTITADERAELCDLFDEVGPDAATLLEGWDAGDLLAHLLVRERRPDAAGGILVPFLAARTAKVMGRIRSSTPYATMVETFRGGPPIWSPYALPVIGDKANLVEFHVHHEDVRRARPEWEVTGLAEDREDAFWSALRLMGRLLYRKAPVGVILQSAGREERRVAKGSSSVTVVGLPSEILLHAFGRAPDVVRVVVQGSAEDIEALAASPRGL